MATKQEIAVVVDVGSTKIAAMAGEMGENGRIQVLAQAMVASRGIKRGVVLNIDEFAEAIREVVVKLEGQFNGKVRRIDVAMAGQGIQTLTFEGIRYTGETGIVRQQDIDYLWSEARNMPLDPGNKIYHIFPSSYTIDDEPNINVPVGHAGRKILAVFKLVTGPVSYQENVSRALSKLGIQLGKFILSPVATAEAVVSDEEKEAGVAVVDLGGGNTKLTVFLNGALTRTTVIPFAGEAITRDIKEGCSILAKWAEQLKIQYGQAMGDFAEEEKVVTIAGTNGWESKEISFKSLAYIIQARLEEIIDSVCFEMEKSGFFDQPTQGIIITGGASKLVNLLQLVKFRSGLDARLGFSQVRIERTVQIDKSAFITALGLLKMSLTNVQAGDNTSVLPNRRKKPVAQGKGFFSSLSEKVTQQITMIFDEEDASL